VKRLLRYTTDKEMNMDELDRKIKDLKGMFYDQPLVMELIDTYDKQ